jgi:hypothetical protein
MQLAEAKARLTISALWEILQLPGRPGKCCRCPWREDRHPSFSVFADDSKWKDHATGESGDAVDFLRIASQVSNADACRQFIALVQGRSLAPAIPINLSRHPPKPYTTPRMVEGSGLQYKLLADSRHVSVAALEIAFRRGLLLFGNYRGYSSWFVTDISRKIVQARRLDGGRWWNHGPKALNLPGTTPSWPAGTASINAFSRVLAVEGGPDMLSAFHFLWMAQAHDQVTAVAILGAHNTILSDALPLFNNKRIRIVPHDDQAGARAATCWRNQFLTVAAKVDVQPIHVLAPDAVMAKDLNDLCRTPPEVQAQVASTLINDL